jgi:hypothetical protein
VRLGEYLAAHRPHFEASTEPAPTAYALITLVYVPCPCRAYWIAPSVVDDGEERLG